MQELSALAPWEMIIFVQASDFGVKIAVSSIANAQNAVFLIIFVLSFNCLILFPVSDKDNFFLNMKLKFIFIFLFAFLSLSSLDAFAQDQDVDEDKRMDESIEQVLENLERDLYNQIQDKWMEQMYNAFEVVLDEPQWNRYLKAGAAREKKARDKRAAKRQKN